MTVFITTLLFIFFSASSLAGAQLPKRPAGWVELTSSEPVILTWTKSPTDKKLTAIPSVAIQKFARNEKFEKFVKEKPLDKNLCRDLIDGGWTQTWCLRPKNILILLSRNEDSDTASIKDQLLKWILSYQ